MSSAIQREQKIIEVLQKQGSASIHELAEFFSVSNMTIHRDLNKLEKAGSLIKKHGGVVLAGTSPQDSEHSCTMCNKPTSSRTLFIVKLENGKQEYACCAHCGLMVQSHKKGTGQSLTTDYLHGHMVSVKQAIYLLDCELNICCVPSILCFASQQDALKFKKGFGGKLVNFGDVLSNLQEMIRHQ